MFCTYYLTPEACTHRGNGIRYDENQYLFDKQTGQYCNPNGASGWCLTVNSKTMHLCLVVASKYVISDLWIWNKKRMQWPRKKVLHRHHYRGSEKGLEHTKNTVANRVPSSLCLGSFRFDDSGPKDIHFDGFISYCKHLRRYKRISQR